MFNDRIIYSTDDDWISSDRMKNNEVPVSYTKRANAPGTGDVFTAIALKNDNKRDLIISAISNHTGYIKENYSNPISVIPGQYYRFKIVGGPHYKNNHNYFYAIPIRDVAEDEGLGLNKIDGQNSLLIQRLAEFMFGMGWDRRKRKNFRLTEKQRNWNWFHQNLM